MVMRKLLYSALLLLLVVSFGCGGGKEEEKAPAQPSATAPSAGTNMYDSAKSTASVGGKVTFEGAAPTMAKLQLTPECQQAHGGPAFEEHVKVNPDNTLANVFVYVKEGAEKWNYPEPTDQPVLDQLGCQYVPHVLAVRVNQNLTIVNSDPFLHNVHPQPTANQQFNQGMPVKGMKIEHKFAAPEIMIPVKCDVHRWMQAYIAVMKHPFYNISGDDGSYSIKNLPAGNFTIEAWHEKYGAQTQQITVTDGESKEVSFNFKAS